MARADGRAELLLERYRLIRRLGAGGFGVVWEAHDELLGREVALKCISLPGRIDRERATREAMVSARLSHPAIVALYEAHCEQDEFYLASELVRGQTLDQLIAADGLSDRRIIEIGVSLAEALEHAHEQGVVHRDVKPQNVLIAEHPRQPEQSVKLADFGGAHLAGADVLTHTGDVLGTLAYMAPEQSEGLRADASADLYSLALVLYEAFSGINPVRGQTPAATVRRIGRAITPLERSRRDLARELTHAVDCALAPRAEQRGTLAQLRGALEKELCEQPADDREAHWGPGRSRARQTGRHRVAKQASPIDYPTERAQRRWYELPRVCWLACAGGVILWQALSGQTGVALLLGAAALPLLALPRRSGPGWCTCALAPALGLIGLAGVFPAIAGLRSGWRARAALGALGYWWLTLGEPLAGRRLWLGSTARTPPLWQSSLHATATHVLFPLLTSGVLLGAGVWAVGSMLLAWLVRGRRFAVDAVLVSVWAGALVAVQPLLDSGLPAKAVAPAPRELILSTILAGVVAVGARALRGPL
ncbi:MAG TPA: serine/threonine-protein kinase [Solirubrobacteraceae bacterium]